MKKLYLVNYKVIGGEFQIKSFDDYTSAHSFALLKNRFKSVSSISIELVEFQEDIGVVKLLEKELIKINGVSCENMNTK